MASGGEKKWARPWSMEEMIENSENWSLAGDVALLNTLKAFSENLFSKTVAISDNVDNLLHSLDEVGLKLNLSQNEFQSLRNTQFVESRVYEEDETLDVKEENKPEQKVASEEEKEKMMKESVTEGLRIMDKYFEKVEVSISDSEDEESDKSYVLRAKDLYADRPLPLVIGTEEWYKKWHVGLASSSSESESDKVSETYSDSESGDDLPKDLIKGSETSSELDFSSQTSENRPVANSTFNETAAKPNVFASDGESDEQSSVPVKAPISNKNFAEQLAAKLGDVINEREDIASEINRKPIQPAQKSKYAGDLFFDEPPPLDDLDDTILPKSAQEGLFSGGRGLFDDNEDDLFWGQQNKGPTVKPPDVTHDVKPQTEEKTNVVATPLPKSSQVQKGPFDTDSDSSDEDIFSTRHKPATKQPFLQPFGTAAPLFDEEPPELEPPNKPTEETSKKKPVGGVSIFGTSDIFSGRNVEDVLKSNKNPTDIDKGKEKIHTEPSQAVIPSVKTEKSSISKQPSLFEDDKSTENDSASPRKPQKISLFDDDDDLFKDDLFSGIAPKKLTSNLFDDLGEGEDLFPAKSDKNETPKVDLFTDLADIEDENKTERKPKKIVNLFDEDEDLFSEKAPVTTNVKSASNNTVEVGVTEKNEALNRTGTVDDEVDKGLSETVEDLPQRHVIGAEKSVEKRPTLSLFDDSPKDSDTEDLFAIDVKKMPGQSLFEDDRRSEIEKKIPSQTTKSEVENLSQTTNTDSKPNVESSIEISQSKSTVNLFGSSPPPDDGDWDSKSIQSSDNDDQFSYRIDYNTAGSSLFDNEPPSLAANESSGIVRDENITNVDTDDSSFYPYASSSRRLSSDVFSDQQSQDSLFVTKSRVDSVTVPPQLDRISESTSGSNLDITPSGKLEDLLSSEGDNSVFQDNTEPNQTTTSNPKKPISLFDDEPDDSNDTDDLFASISKTPETPKLSDKRLSLFDNTENTTKSEVKPKNPDEKETEDSPKDSETKHSDQKEILDVSKDSKVEELPAKEEAKNVPAPDETDRKEPKKPPIASPGKLKHNLKINVSALMPGAAPPKLRDLPKSQSLDLPKDHKDVPAHASSPDGGFLTPTTLIPRQETLSNTPEKAVSFEDALNKVEVLHSVTKDRVRIPIKRRPSTRRGRQQAIHDTGSDFTVEGGASGDTTVEQLDTTETKVEEVRPVVVEVSGEPKPEPPVTSTSIQEAKTVNLKPLVPEETPSIQEAKTVKLKPLVPEETQPKASNIFDDVGNENEDLFVGTTSKTVIEENTKSSIFESEDSEDDLFGTGRARKGKKDTGHKKLDTAKKKSLFNDSSSDEDLFSAKSNVGAKKRESGQKVVEKKVQKSSTTRKLENIETDEDPLSSLLK